MKSAPRFLQSVHAIPGEGQALCVRGGSSTGRPVGDPGRVEG